MRSSSGPGADSALLELRSISKAFTGVQALAEVDFDARAGEIHAIVGENGAGKSTLIKILAGAHAPDSGEIVWNGVPIEIPSPQRAHALGIATIYQEFSLIPELTIMENVLLGREPATAGFIRFRELRETAERALAELDMHLDPGAQVSRLSVAQMQMVEIAKAVSQNARLLVMDEPSATLTEHELEGLYRLVRGLRDGGRSVIYVSHRLEEVLSLADRITVLRDGRHIATLDAADASAQDVIRLMVGREITEQFPAASADSPGEKLLEFEDVSTVKLRGVSFSVRKGEIVGVAGLVGAGRSALGRAALGVDRIVRGNIRVRGTELRVKSPRDSVRAGIGLLAEDRKRQGLVLQLPVRANLSLASLDRISRLGFVFRRAEAARASELGALLRVRMSTIEQPIAELSGGNQQKVLIGRWLWRECPVMIFDEPTRGVDVGAKAEIYGLLRQLAEQGVAILMISSDLPEVLGMADRVLVMRDGSIVAELSGAEASQESVMQFAVGHRAPAAF